MTSARWTNGILAIWLALSAFLGFTVVSNVVNLVAVGVIMVGVGIALSEDSKWQGWTTTVAGLWLVAAVFVPGLRTGPGLLWNSLIVAVVVLAASLPFPADEKASPRRPSRVEEPSASDEQPWRELEHEHHEHEEQKLAHR